MADQAIQELSRLSLERWIAFELLERPLEPMADLDITATQRAGQLLVVVTSHAEGNAVADHRHDQAKNAG